MSELRYYTGAEVLEIADRIVAEQGKDFVYPKIHDHRYPTGNGCLYVRDGKPSCLIGRIAFEMGATVEWLEQFEVKDARTVMGHKNNWDNTLYPKNQWFEVSERTAELLTQVQNRQDSGCTWHDAVDRSREDLANS